MQTSIEEILAARLLWNAAKHCLNQWNIQPFHSSVTFSTNEDFRKSPYLDAYIFLKHQAYLLDPLFKEVL